MAYRTPGSITITQDAVGAVNNAAERLAAQQGQLQVSALRSAAVATAASNPCEDIQLLPLPLPPFFYPPDPSTDRAAPSAMPGSPPDPQDEPMAQEAQQFRAARYTSANEGRESPELLLVRSSEPAFATSIREVTTVPMGSYISPDTIILVGDFVRTRDFVRPNHPAYWTRYLPLAEQGRADKFRLSILNVWSHMLSDSSGGEEFFNDIVGDPSSKRTYSIQPQISPEKRQKIDLLNPVIKLDSTYPRWDTDVIEGKTEISETIRFHFNTDRIKGALVPRENRFFTLPAAAAQNNFSSLSFFYDLYIRGSSSQMWDVRVAESADYSSQQLGLLYAMASGSVEFEKYHWDYVYDAPVAFSEKEANNFVMTPFHSADVVPYVYDVSPVMRNKTDENGDIRKEEITDEKEMPNIYEYYQAILTTKNISNGKVYGSNEQTEAIADHFNNIIDYSKNPRNENMYESKSVLKFPADRVAMLKEANDTILNKFATPTNYVRININTRQGGELAGAIQSTGMDTQFLELLSPTEGTSLYEDLLTSDSPILNSIKRTSNWQDVSVARILDEDLLGNPRQNQQNVIRTSNDKVSNNVPSELVISPDSWLKLLPIFSENDTVDFLDRSLGDYPLLYKGFDNKQVARLEEFIGSQIFLSKLNLLIAQNTLQRSFMDVLKGKKCYAETIGYKVEKHKKLENGTEELVQTFYFMDNNDVDRFSYIDSQILPNNTYIYRVFTINAVVGTRYFYDRAGTVTYWDKEDGFVNQNIRRNLERDEARQPRPDFNIGIAGQLQPKLTEMDNKKSRFDLKVFSDRALVISYAPFYQEEISTVDAPPMVPQVNVLPYQGTPDEISFLFNINYGDFEDYRVNLRSGRQEEKVHFKTDSLPSAFSIYRIEEPPMRYADFLNSPTRFDIRVKAEGKTGFYRDVIQPNKDYYYAFRVYDNYDIDYPETHPINKDKKYSNPTPVYKIRIVDYENGIFVKSELYEMAPPQDQFKLCFNRFIKITPNTNNSRLNFDASLEEAANNVSSFTSELRSELSIPTNPQDTVEFQRSAPALDSIKIGHAPPETEIWNKKFKMRIRSKTTGKMVDFNFQFKNDNKTEV